MQKKQTITDYMNANESYYVSYERDEHIVRIAEPIIQTGIKEKDAFHVACAIFAQCDYFITTDDRLLKYQTDQIPLVTPGEFIRRLEADK